MTHQLLFVQGGGAGAHDEWDSKLVASLRRALGPGYDIRYPRMPKENDPSFAAWEATLQQEIANLDDGAIVLIATPFVGEGGWPTDNWQPESDLGGKLPRGVPIYLYHGEADTTAPPAHAELYARAIPQAHICLLAGRDHQLDNDLREIAAVITRLG